jgi:hypothetical protein
MSVDVWFSYWKEGATVGDFRRIENMGVRRG